MKYYVSASASVTLWAEVEAESAKQAKEIAESTLGVPTPYAQAYSPGDESTWNCDPELGEPQNIEVEAPALDHGDRP